MPHRGQVLCNCPLSKRSFEPGPTRRLITSNEFWSHRKRFVWKLEVAFGGITASG